MSVDFSFLVFFFYSTVMPVSMQELLWYDEVLAAELRTGDASSFADR